MNKRFSCASCFLTISPANLDNPRSIQLAFHSRDNKTFPAMFEEGCSYGSDGENFMKHLRDGSSLVSEGVIRLPKSVITKAKRADLAMNNPVAYVQENKTLLNDIMSILLGFSVEDEGYYTCTESQSERATHHYKSKKGIFGH